VGLHVQYGCGLSAPPEWENFDASLTLRFQRVPVIGAMLRGRMTVVFPEQVRYGDIVRGYPCRTILAMASIPRTYWNTSRSRIFEPP
jgi:hypothetical protein